MLIYHPVGDFHHCCYRLIRLLSSVATPLPEQTLMLGDFFSLFPGQLKCIQGWPRANSKAYKIVKSIPDEFEELLNTKRVFFQLKEIQVAAISNLCAKGIFQVTSKVPNTYLLLGDNVPDGIKEKVESDAFATSEPYRLIVQDLCKLDLLGKNGLKKKTGLLESMYD